MHKDFKVLSDPFPVDRQGVPVARNVKFPTLRPGFSAKANKILQFKIIDNFGGEQLYSLAL